MEGVFSQASAGGGASTLKTVRADGTGDYLTIQAAVNAAQPGWEIVVYPGSYGPATIGPNRDGAAGQRITLRALHRYDAAQPALNSLIVQPSTASGTYGLVVNKSDYWTLDGFGVSGGREGAIGVIGDISPYNPCSAIIVQHCDARGAVEDGIKVAQARDVQLLDNVAVGGNDQGIDLYGVIGGTVRGNTASCPVQAGCVIKTGSSDVVIEYNNFSSASGNALRIGDASGTNPTYPPATTGMQAEVRNIVSRFNTLHSDSAAPVIAYGALDCSSLSDSRSSGNGGASMIRVRESRDGSNQVKFVSANFTTDALTATVSIEGGSNAIFV